MTNNEPRSTDDLTAAMLATNARRIAQLQADAADMKANRWMPPSNQIKRLPPKSRRHSVRHRAIR